MNASEVLAALRVHHSTAALVHEVSIRDDYWLDNWTETERTKPIRRIDALMFDGLQRTAIEIKVSKADYRRDTWQKREAWHRVVHRFVYAVPKGLLEGEGLPHNCGVWEVDDVGRVTVLKKAKINITPEPLPQSVVQALAYRAAGVPLVTAKEVA